jgi:hypothetical protein
MRIQYFRFGLVLFLLLELSLNSVSPPQASADSFADPAFKAVWNRTDAPVMAGTVARTTVWGPEPFAALNERYDNSPGKQRQVQYFDKGRMEITNPEADPQNGWFVSSGLLVRDLVAGLVQVGDNTGNIYDPVEIPIAGDDNSPNLITPFYADMNSQVFRTNPNTAAVGQQITLTIRRGGRTGRRDQRLEPKINNGYYESTSAHNIAAPFWDFMNSTGPVNTPDGRTVTGALMEWQYIMGYPVSEPFWTTARIAGQDQEILVQLFQRRVLTFNPANPPEYRVEFTNIGRHYYNWRYGAVPVPQGDLSVPASVNGKVTPAFGDENTIFQVTAHNYKANEGVNFIIFPPNGGSITEKDLGTLKANAAGTLALAFYGDSFVFLVDGDPLGIYRMEVTGQESGQKSVIYWRFIDRVAITPTSPYNADTKPPPPNQNGISIPPVGTLNTSFGGFVPDFQAKDLDSGKVSAWVTAPNEQVLGVSPGFLSDEETLNGVFINLGSLPYTGVWALTMVYKNNPTKKVILYFKVTEVPADYTIGASLYSVSRISIGTASHLQAAALNWLDLRKAKVEPVEGEAE